MPEDQVPLLRKKVRLAIRRLLDLPVRTYDFDEFLLVVSAEERDEDPLEALLGRSGPPPWHRSWRSIEMPAHEGEQEKSSSTASAPRKLVRVEALELRDPHGKVVGSPQAPRPAGPKSIIDDLFEPRRGANAPRARTISPEYRPVDREDVAMQLLRQVVDGPVDDLRTQRGVGADAIDDEGRMYELKVSAGREPDEITLTAAELRRALIHPEYILVIVSNVEETGAMPTLRMIPDPLRQLRSVDSGGIRLAGIRDAHSLLYEFDSTDPPDGYGGGDPESSESANGP